MKNDAMSEGVLWKCISFRSSKSLKLSGMLADAGAKMTVIHVHGACGNYFSAGYIDALATACLRARINFLTINTSGHDCIAEGYRGDSYEYVGGSISNFSECVDDITGAIDVARGFSDDIVLAGHSLGCDRIVHYARETRKGHPLVLISPCDSYRLHEIFLGGMSVEDHIRRLRQMAPRDKFELLPMKQYGIHNKSERYFIPVTRDTLLSIIDGPPFSQFRLDKPGSFKLQNSCLVCIGERDNLQTASAQEMFAYMSGHFGNCSNYLSPDGDHEFAGVEAQMSAAVVRWISNENG